jgi:hypothetical protein
MKCVYKLKCRDKEITEFYIGSSIDFRERKYNHKNNSNNLLRRPYCYPLYMFINVNGGFNNWEFEVIKEYKFITKKELNINEQCYKELLKPQLNSINANGVDLERKKNTMKIISKIRNKIKINCPHCNIELLKTSIHRHIKTCKGFDLK